MKPESHCYLSRPSCRRVDLLQALRCRSRRIDRLWRNHNLEQSRWLHQALRGGLGDDARTAVRICVESVLDELRSFRWHLPERKPNVRRMSLPARNKPPELRSPQTRPARPKTPAALFRRVPSLRLSKAQFDRAFRGGTEAQRDLLLECDAEPRSRLRLRQRWVHRFHLRPRRPLLHRTRAILENAPPVSPGSRRERTAWFAARTCPSCQGQRGV